MHRAHSVTASCTALLLGISAIGRLAAQTSAPARAHVVAGVVFDSVARVPLAAAVVQVMSLDSVSRVTTATTDTNGRFRFASLPSGRFLIGFYHDALNALGLDAPQRAFELTAATASASVDLGIPSGAVVRALRCGGDSAERRDGMLAGMVRDAEHGEALDGAIVTAEWLAIALDSGNYRTVTQRAAATVATDGTYAVCGVPVDAPVTVRVNRHGYRPIVGPALVPASGAARQSFRLSDSVATHGPASLALRVVRQDGRPLASGRALVSALEREAPIESGAFALNDVPPGTWVVEVRAIGFDPQSFAIDAEVGVNRSTTITMTERPVQLDVVSVVGKPSRETRLLQDVLFRKRYGPGTVFLPNDSWLTGAMLPSDVLRAARGFSYNGARGCQYPAIKGKSLKVYVDGNLYPLGLSGLNALIQAQDVLAVEAYPDMIGVPPQWRTSDACALVIVWTKR